MNKHIEAAAAALSEHTISAKPMARMAVNAYLQSLAAEGEDGLVEAMRDAYDQHTNGWEFAIGTGMRAALAVVRAADGTELERLRTAIQKINDIRNSIVGFQRMGFSEHVYPLVAALEEAGIRGEGYDVARDRIRTALSRAEAAEARVKELEAQSTNYFALATDRFLALIAAEASERRLRAALEEAPHAEGCASSGLRYAAQIEQYCDCFKAEAKEQPHG